VKRSRWSAGLLLGALILGISTSIAAAHGPMSHLSFHAGNPESSAHGKMVFRGEGDAFGFVFFGRKLAPGKTYRLVYRYRDGSVVTPLGEAAANRMGGLVIRGSAGFDYLPERADGNYPNGADLRLVSEEAGDGLIADRLIIFNPWKAVSARLQAATMKDENGKVEAPNGIGLDIYDCRDRLVFSETAGGFSRADHVDVGSAAKWVTAATVLTLVKDGVLSLDDTTGKWLGWRNKTADSPDGEVTLRQLLSLTAGYEVAPTQAPTKTPCIYSTGGTFVPLESCVQSLYATGAYAFNRAPGKFFYYGPLPIIVAGRIAEAASGKPFSELFWEKLGAPLGFDKLQTRYDPANQLAGSLWMSLEEYGRFLTMIHRNGKVKNKWILTPDLVAEQMSDQFEPDTKIKFSPFNIPQLGNQLYHYGLGVWRECPDPADASACDEALTVSSEGGYGWYPFMDTQRDYYGILGMYRGAPSPGYVDAYKILQELKPFIHAGLGVE
jgi:CubicO group peptidase (beta-lactamase class C family)